jgi:uncharacterized membrane protein YccF (DUF307 family)
LKILFHFHSTYQWFLINWLEITLRAIILILFGLWMRHIVKGVVGRAVEIRFNFIDSRIKVIQAEIANIGRQMASEQTKVNTMTATFAGVQHELRTLTAVVQAVGILFKTRPQKP